MVSEIDICNSALLRINGNQITSFDQDTKEGRACKVLYTQIRDLELYDHAWKFALARSSLVKNTATPAFEYAYSYAAPADMLRPVSLYNHSGAWAQIGEDIETNSDSAKLVYIKKVTNTGEFTPGFVECLILRLASALERALFGSSTHKELLMREYKDQLALARRVNALFDSSKKLNSNGWVRTEQSTPWWYNY